MKQDDFATLLRSYRERAGRSCHAIAIEVDIDPSYWHRCESAQRDPPRRYIVLSMANALHLSIGERNRLFVAAGYVPPSLTQLGGWEDCLESCVDVLNDPRLSDWQKDNFRRLVMDLAARVRCRDAETEPQSRLGVA